MRSFFTCKALLLGAFLAIALGDTAVRGDFIATESTSVQKLSSNLYFYSYTVSVSANSTASASEFDLSLNAPVMENTIVNPTNFFAFYTSGDPFITFTAFDNGTPFSGIAPGSSGTFSFYSSFSPVMGFYQTSGFDSTSGVFSTVTGSVLVPGLVPEPSSLLLSSLGFCGVLGLVARSRSREVVAVG